MQHNNGSGSSHNGDSSQSAGIDPSDSPPQTPDTIHDQIAYYRSFLDQLLGIVRHGDQESVNRMVTAIRSHASDEEILALLTQISGVSGPAEEESREQGNNNGR
ncbi:hypothetical protein BO70DRAFT_392276 [Aspergillus heteromorphus CBS 117.55]|uniref:Uncharacterized protein n=1 Tax=Aspergillus heteromorphus CBS 117.55 TaxID=1448321 RepID=A0A317X2X4_9EURO|nr:uncharacterized protein BO70DRAFT_392276 [Aspergillus heteromorphus CBS 117.55]PWY92903.1 hypothetical protein BO70DRAFT_392276 [Aspergillus heteromorphus CBS 117.55]